MRVIATSMPTIARNWPATNASGASSTDHGARASVLVVIGEAADQVVQPRDVVVDRHRAVDVGYHVIPGRHHPPMLGLGRIPTRRDVGVRPADDHQRLAAVGVAPVLVVACEMALQGGAFTVVDERQHRGLEPVRPRSHEVRRLVAGQQLVDGVVVWCEVSGDVHRNHLPLPCSTGEYARIGDTSEFHEGAAK